MTQFQHRPENFGNVFQTFGGENSWIHAASQDAYVRGSYHPHGRGVHHEGSRYLPEVGFHGHHQGRHRWEGHGEGRHHWRNHHHGRIGRSLGGDDSAPQNYAPQPGENSGFPGFGDQPQMPGFGQPQQYGKNRGGWPGSSFAPPEDGEQPDPRRERRSRRNAAAQPDEGGPAPEYHGRAGGHLTNGQERFAAEFAAKTGLNQSVVGNWLLKEESGRAAQNREAQGNQNWLNIGYTDSGHRGIGNRFWHGSPEAAADASAAWMKGELNVPGFGRASNGIRRIQDAVGQSPSTQMAMIAGSGWASSHYGYGSASHHHHRNNYLDTEYASRSYYRPWRYHQERG